MVEGQTMLMRKRHYTNPGLGIRKNVCLFFFDDWLSVMPHDKLVTCPRYKPRQKMEGGVDRGRDVRIMQENQA